MRIDQNDQGDGVQVQLDAGQWPLLRELGWYQESTPNKEVDDSESGASRIAKVQTARDDALKQNKSDD